MNVPPLPVASARATMLPYHDVHLNGGGATARLPHGQAWLDIARALLDPASIPRDLRRAVAAHAPFDRDRWWTESPFRNLQAGGLTILASPGVDRHHDARSLLAVAVMSPHRWAWPELVEHWDRAYASDGQRSPHLDWIRPAICQAQVHQASPETMAWWLDHHPAFRDDPQNHAVQAARNALVRAWWRGLTHWAGTGRSDNVVIAGDVPAQDVWAVFDVLHAHGLAAVEDWSHLRNLASDRRGATPNATADRASPRVMAPIEAVIELRGSEPVLERWLAEGGDPTLTNPYSGVALVQRALQCTTPTNLQRLIDAGASLDVAAGAWERDNRHGRKAGVLGYPWNGSTDRFPTSVVEQTVPPPSPWWDDHASPGPRDQRVEREETHLGLEIVLRWCAEHHTALRLGEDIGVKDVWNAGAWQAWLDRRELLRTLKPEDFPMPVGSTTPRRRL